MRAYLGLFDEFGYSFYPFKPQKFLVWQMLDSHWVGIDRGVFYALLDAIDRVAEMGLTAPSQLTVLSTCNDTSSLSSLASAYAGARLLQW
jgi:hypothetical protein